MPNSQIPRVHVGKAARILMSELGLNEITVLRRARLPSSLFDGDGSWVSLSQYHCLLESVTQEADDPLLALKLGDAAGIDYFDPAFFAAMCSPDMNVAAQRLADYKRLVSPFTLDVQVGDQATQVTFICVGEDTVHPTMALTEIVFLVNFARRATRHQVIPASVSMPFDLPDPTAYQAHFGCPIEKSEHRSVTFTRDDACRPFVTHDDELWALFEPRLRRQIDVGGKDPTTRTKVAHCLNELLPSGRATVEEVAKDLAMSKRTLQRRLAQEGTSWAEILSDAREALAKHYLKTTEFGAAEVGFLLGYEDPNSFFRAFKRWEDTSPELWRTRHRGQRNELH